MALPAHNFTRKQKVRNHKPVLGTHYTTGKQSNWGLEELTKGVGGRGLIADDGDPVVDERVSGHHYLQAAEERI